LFITVLVYFLGLKGYDYQSTTVVADEVFYFKNPIHPQKVIVNILTSRPKLSLKIGKQ
jgi:hypothetical protein